MNKFLPALAFFLGIIAPPPAVAQDAEITAVCRATEVSRALDFWTGDYRVISNNEKKEVYGVNLIESVLDGCAIIENWQSSNGAMGKSLFYFDARANTWTQVWVTGDTSQPWGLKIKHLVKVFENGAVRFQSRQMLDEGDSYLDRTTLTPLADGTFRQLIEISRDGGDTWDSTFDALYIPNE